MYGGCYLERAFDAAAVLLCSWRAAGQICRAMGSIRARWPYFWTFTSALVIPAPMQSSQALRKQRLLLQVAEELLFS